MTKSRTTFTSLTTGLAIVALGISVPNTVSADEPAACTSEVTAGTGSWAIKESYLSYIFKPVTRGEIFATNGASIADPKKGPFTFTVDPQRSTIESVSKGVIGLNGDIVIHGHKKAEQWELDQQLSDLKVVIDGNKGQIMADYISAKYPNPDGAAAPFTADDAVIATVTWDTAPSLTSGKIDVTDAPVVLTDKGASELFAGFYSAGQELAPLSLDVTLGNGCGQNQPDSESADEQTPQKTSVTTTPTETPKPKPSPKEPESPTPESDQGGSVFGSELMKTLRTDPVSGIMSILVLLGATAVLGVVLQHVATLFKR